MPAKRKPPDRDKFPRQSSNLTDCSSSPELRAQPDTCAPWIFRNVTPHRLSACPQNHIPPPLLSRNVRVYLPCAFPKNHSLFFIQGDITGKLRVRGT